MRWFTLLVTFFIIMVGLWADYVWVSVLGLLFGSQLLMRPEKKKPAPAKKEFLSGKYPQKEFESGMKEAAGFLGSLAHFFVGVKGKKIYSRVFDKDYKGKVETHIIRDKGE